MVASPVFRFVGDCLSFLPLEHLCHTDQVLNIQALAGATEDYPLTGATLEEVALLLKGQVLVFHRQAGIELNLGRSF